MTSNVLGVGKLKYTIVIFQWSKRVAMAIKFMQKSAKIALICSVQKTEKFFCE